MSKVEIISTEKKLGKIINVYGTFEEPLFLAKDVAEWLELTNVTDMVSRVDAEEVTKINLGGLQGECNFLTESGLYEVLMQSRKTIAKKFKKEVKYILSKIRRNGQHDVFKVIEDSFNDKVSSRQISIYTYLLSDKSGLTKIGRTTNIHNRMKQYSTHNPTYILLGYFDGDIECFLHKKYNTNKVLNEWFYLSKNQINNIISSFGFKTNLITEIKQY